ncbi:hypothetical protein AAG906_001608 [Vitis piasezkii]
MDVSLESKSLPSVGYSKKSYLQTTSQRLARGKLVNLHGRRSLALPSVGLEFHSTVQNGCEIISQQKGDFAAKTEVTVLCFLHSIFSLSVVLSLHTLNDFSKGIWSSKACNHKAWWAIKKLNMDLIRAGAKRCLGLNEMEELRNDAYINSKVAK